MGVINCPECGGKVSTTRNDCPHCGYILNKIKVCPDCNESINNELNQCPTCGYIFNDILKKDILKSQELKLSQIENEDNNDSISSNFTIECNDDLKDNINDEMKCPYCGSNLQITIGDKYFLCEDCKNKFFYIDYCQDSYNDNLILEENNQSLTNEKGQLDTDEICKNYDKNQNDNIVEDLTRENKNAGSTEKNNNDKQDFAKDEQTNKKIKTTLVIIVCLLLFAVGVGLIPGSYFSAYKINKGVLVKYTGSSSNLSIPSVITYIGDSAFTGCENLINITIPEGVKGIGNCAFKDCTSLKSITIPNSVTRIESFAFCNCTSLESITIPNSVTRIERFAFCNCTSLKSITIPNSVTSIDDSSFRNCTSLKSITIPNSVTSIADSSFRNCTSLKNIAISDSVISIGSDVFSNCNSLCYNEYDNGLYLGEESNRYVILIKTKDKNITSCIVNEKTKIIYFNAFSDCNSLTNVTISNCISNIGPKAFSCCFSLKKITYLGVCSQWHKISKGSNWDYNTSNYVVDCVDCDITKY